MRAGTGAVCACVARVLPAFIQHFEVDLGGGLTSNTDPSLGEYEEEFMVDRCFGDHVLQTQLDLLRALG